MPSWPTTLPGPIEGSLSFEQEPNVAEYRPDVGGPLRRRRYTATRTLVKAALQLSGDQIETLRSFFHDECADGVVGFDMADWWNLTQGAPTVREFKFDSPPAFDHVSADIYRADLSLSTVR